MTDNSENNKEEENLPVNEPIDDKAENTTIEQQSDTEPDFSIFEPLKEMLEAQSTDRPPTSRK